MCLFIFQSYIFISLTCLFVLFLSISEDTTEKDQRKNEYTMTNVCTNKMKSCKETDTQEIKTENWAYIFIILLYIDDYRDEV